MMDVEVSQDLDVKYRPQTLDDVVGQPEAVAVVRSWGKDIPRCVMFHGGSGTGKTTMAGVIANDLEINEMDLSEVNCGTIVKPTEFIRDLENDVTSSAIGGGKRMWVLDEFQTLRRSKGAQEAFLMVMERSLPHVIFCLCTTEPKQILSTIRGRCVMVGIKPLHHGDIVRLVKRIASKEEVALDSKLVDRIAEVANGSARNAVKELQKVIRIEDPEQRMAAVDGIGGERATFDLVKAMLPFQGKPRWKEVATVLEDIKDEDPEGIRALLLAVARTGLLKGDARSRIMYKVICCFDKPFYDANSGRALLAAGCWEVVESWDK